MSVISWGKCTIKYKGEEDSQFVALPIPVDGSTSLETTEGERMEAKEEGGGIVDVIVKSPEMSLVFDLYLKKPESGETFEVPLDPHDGQVDGEYAFELVPEDAACPGIKIDRARVTTAPQFSSSEGLRMRYTCTALKPTNGDMVKIQVIP